MENTLNTNKFGISNPDRNKMLEKRLVAVNNQIDWLNKIKKTLERQIFEEIPRNF